MTSKEVTYRKIDVEEFEKLKDMFPGSRELWNKYKKERENRLQNKEIDIYVIEKENEIIGEITVNYISHELETEAITNRRVYFEAFRVEKQYKGNGLGQRLLCYAINELKERGYTEFTIGVESDNEIAKHIYFKYGFTEVIDKGKGDEFDPSEYTLYLKRINKEEYMKNTLFKKVEIEDFKYMEEILQNDNIEYNIDNLKKFISGENNYGFVGIKDNKAIAFLYGYGMYRPDGRNMFYIHSVDVLPDYQSMGIGTKLLEFVIEYIKSENKFYKYFVLAEKDNIKACKLYKKFANSNEQVLFSNNI